MNDFLTVYQAELVRRIRSKPFLIGLVIGVLAILATFQMPQWLAGTASGMHTLVVVGPAPIAQRAARLVRADFPVAAVLPPQVPDAKLLAAHKVGEAVVLAARPGGIAVTLYAKDPGNAHAATIGRALAPLQLERAVGLTPARATAALHVPVVVRSVASKFGNSSEAELAHGIAYMLIFFLYILILINSQLLMSSVAEEKTSRIAELLVAAVDPSALLVGKICAAATLALLQIATWIAAAAFMGTQMAGSVAPQAGSPSIVASVLSGHVISLGVIVAFIVFLIVGFLQLSTLFAAMASLINRTEDLGSVAMPLVMPVVIALFVAMAALDAPDASWVVGLSFVPLLAPFVMFARIAVSDVAAWQIALSLAINLAALVGIALLAGKVYRVGLLLYGRTPSLRQIWSVVRA